MKPVLSILAGSLCFCCPWKIFITKSTLREEDPISGPWYLHKTYFTLLENQTRQKCLFTGKMLQVVYCVLTHEVRNGFEILWRITFYYVDIMLHLHQYDRWWCNGCVHFLWIHGFTPSWIWALCLIHDAAFQNVSIQYKVYFSLNFMVLEMLYGMLQ